MSDMKLCPSCDRVMDSNANNSTYYCTWLDCQKIVENDNKKTSEKVFQKKVISEAGKRSIKKLTTYYQG